jgi:hypothetical protein
MRARLFPGTTLDPKTAFTFDVLKEFSMLNLQSKCGAFDYMKSLRRLTDNVSTRTLPVSTTLYLPKSTLTFLQDPYKLLLRVARFWEYLTLKKRTGQCHNINQLFPTRPSGSMVLYCPCCPEVGVNVDKNDERVSSDMRYVTISY